jgi:hypothetical protein
MKQINTQDRIEKLPKWVQKYIKIIRTKELNRRKKTLPWTEKGMEWFTLFHPRFAPKNRAPEKLFTCSRNGTVCVCTLSPNDCVFVGKGKKNNEEAK